MLSNNGSQRPTTNLNTLQKHRDITLARFDKFVQRGQFEDVNLNTCLWKKRNSEAVSLLVYAVPDLKRISFQEAIKGDYKPTSVGSWFGPTLATFWFKVSIVIPPSFADEEVLFEFDASNEAMIWTSDGRPVTGLTGGTNDDRHADYKLTNKAKPGEKFEFYVEMACNFRGGIIQGPTPHPDMNQQWKLVMADISVRNKLGSSLWLYFNTLVQLVKETPQEWQINADALYYADSIINTFRLGDERSLIDALDIAIKFFSDRKKESRSLHELNAIGNCHIDTAWLWPFDETKRKAGRSWARQIMFMKSNPNFTFTASQAQQFEWVEQLYPTLFRDIQEFSKKGQFLPAGGTWVEMDCNMPSGEALCRQFLYGQRYFESRFGKRSTVFWLPDTFGYSAQLPQLSTLAGMKYFFTQKLSWNAINKFPHTTFKWAGSPTHIKDKCNVGEIVGSVLNNKDKLYSNKSIYLYGNGDGGGGPLPHMIDRLEILAEVEGLPATIKNCDPAKFYKELEASSPDLNRWKGELYFELHRGTLLNQFHDVLPGSSIKLVYDDAMRFYEDVETSGNKLKNNALKALIGDPAERNGKRLEPGITTINTTSWPVTAVVEVQVDKSLVWSNYLESCIQITQTGNPIVYVDSVHGGSLKSFALDNINSALVPVTVHCGFDTQKVFEVENKFIKVKIDAHGRILSLFEKESSREAVAPNQAGNVFKIFEDIPTGWDAWEVEVYHLQKGWDAGVGLIEVEEAGPLRVVLKVQHPITASSTLEQRIIITAADAMIEFETKVDWIENHVLLKVEFPFNVNSDNATYESQFGYVQRPTHYNTSWDLARFEVCGHRYADISEFGFGVSLFNDCKPLMIQPTWSNTLSDMPVYPHKGSFLESNVVQKAYQFNEKPIIHPTLINSSALISSEFFTVSHSNFVLDTVKVAEDPRVSGKNGQVDVVLRFYEAYGGRGVARVDTLFNIKEARFCNILEDMEDKVLIENSGKSLEVPFGPFKVVTIRLLIGN
ncbi:glycosyl hydrolases family 38 N-terminal domain-containing protein [Obelidium mucronatum]|nr:glycosyl hydrolases family 38 N-terminal domain-containing protein [Obelidium mucronatum]